MAKLPLLIAPLERKLHPRLVPLFGGSYSLGWLCESEQGAHWIVWGNSKDKEAAQACRDEVLLSGEREVLIWDQPLTKQIGAEQLRAIREGQVKPA